MQIVHAVPLIFLVLLIGRIDPGLNKSSTIISHVVSFLFLDRAALDVVTNHESELACRAELSVSCEFVWFRGSFDPGA